MDKMPDFLIVTFYHPIHARIRMLLYLLNPFYFSSLGFFLWLGVCRLLRYERKKVEYYSYLLVPCVVWWWWWWWLKEWATVSEGYSSIILLCFWVDLIALDSRRGARNVLLLVIRWLLVHKFFVRFVLCPDFSGCLVTMNVRLDTRQQFTVCALRRICF